MQESKPISVREFLLAAVALVAATLIQIYAGSLLSERPFDYCWTKPFWLDEHHTLLIAGEPSFSDQMQKLARGADYAPPGLYCLLRVWTFVTGAPNELGLRLFSCFSVFAGLMGVYWLLRQSFSSLVAFAATLGLWSAHPLLIDHTLDARFYAPWFAFAVWTCNALLLVTRAPRHAPYCVLTVVLSILLCTIHYFGIVTLALILCCQLLFHARSRRNWLQDIALCVPGPIVLALFAPYYFGQRDALSDPSWMEKPTLVASLIYLRRFFTSFYLPVCAVLFLIHRFLYSRQSTMPSEARTAAPLRPQAGTLALLLLPVCMVVFSFVAQPALMQRYSLPALIGLAPIAAWLLAHLHRALVVVAAVIFLLLGAHHAQDAFQTKKDLAVLTLLDDARHHGTPVKERINLKRPLLLVDRDVGYPVWRYSRLEPRALGLTFNGDASESVLRIRVEKSVAVRMAQLFPTLPHVIPEAEIASLRELYLIDRRPAATVAKSFSRFKLTLLAREGELGLYFLQAKP